MGKRRAPRILDFWAVRDGIAISGAESLAVGDAEILAFAELMPIAAGGVAKLLYLTAIARPVPRLKILVAQVKAVFVAMDIPVREEGATVEFACLVGLDVAIGTI